LLQQRREAEDNAVVAASAALAIDKEGVLARLLAVYEAGVRRKKEGTAENLSAAIRALELVGKELGMFMDRRDVQPGSIEDWLARCCADDGKRPVSTVLRRC
jgi:hypothetical protein